MFLFFSLASSAGARTVNGQTSTSQTIRATVAATDTASGKVLKPLVVFKGKPGARIETREFPTYPANNAYACQETVWMDERVMLLWVRTVLKPFIQDCSINIQPLLLLDSYECQTMARVTGELEALGVQVEIIPGGCTGMCQPIDVGIGMSLKTRAMHLWEEWMVAECAGGRASRPASQLQMCQWIANSVLQIHSSELLVRNSWRHHEYLHFRNKETVAAITAGGGEDTVVEPGEAQAVAEEEPGEPNSSDNGSSL